MTCRTKWHSCSDPVSLVDDVQAIEITRAQFDMCMDGSSFMLNQSDRGHALSTLAHIYLLQS